MNIAYVCMDRGIPLRGHKGAASHVREFCAALGRAGHDVEVFGARLGDTENSLPCAAQIIGEARGSDEAGVPGAGAARERRELDRNHELRRRLDRAHRARRVELIYERYSLWSHAACSLARARGIPYVLEVNSPLRREQTEHRELHLDGVAARNERRLFTDADLVVAVSDAVADYVSSIRGSSSGVLVVPNGVDLGLFAAPTTPDGSHRSRHFVIGFVGSLKPWHGLEILLAAFAMLAAEDPAYRLLLVGDGPRRRAVERTASSRGLADRISMTGAVPKSRIPALLRGMDVGVAPYPALSPFYFSPLKLFEYMAAGVPIIASDIGQIRTVIDDGRTGCLVPAGDPYALRAGLRRLRGNPNLRRRLSRAARKTAMSEHGWGCRVDRILGVLPTLRPAATLTGAVG